MSNEVALMFPVGRMIQGDLYKPTTTDAEGKPLTTKNGPNAGQPRVQYFMAVAYTKTPGVTHWSQEPWGAPIWAAAHAAWPGGQASGPAFAFKIVDGDSQVPDTKGIKPCDKANHRGNWVVKFASGYAPKIVTKDGSAAIIEPDALKCGYYVQPYATVTSNTSQLKPGMYINMQIVALSGFGEVISSGPDAAGLGFGGAALPPGASAVPVGGMSAPPAPVPAPPPVPAAPLVPTPAPSPTFVAGAAAPVPPPPPVPTAPAAPVKVMTAKAIAEGQTYEGMLAANWTDALMIQYGYLNP